MAHLKEKKHKSTETWKRIDSRLTRQRLKNNCLKEAQRTKGAGGENQEKSEQNRNIQRERKPKRKQKRNPGAENYSNWN